MTPINEFIERALSEESKDIGFALSTCKQLMTEQGVSSEVMRETIERLEDCVSYENKLAKALQRAVDGFNRINLETGGEDHSEHALTDIQKILADDRGHRSNDSTNHSEDK